MPGPLLRLPHHRGEPLVDVPANVVERTTVDRRRDQRVGEADPLVSGLEDARGQAFLETPARGLRPEHGFEDRDGRLGQGGRVQGDRRGRRSERFDPLADQVVEAAWDRQGGRRRGPAAGHEFAAQFEGIERGPAGDPVEARDDGAGQLEVQAGPQQAVDLVDREGTHVDARQSIGGHGRQPRW